jgi:hypothetical protein
MSVLIQGSQVRQIELGQRVSKTITVPGAGTQALFTIAGGRVLLTSLYGVVTTAITVAGTSQLQSNPTAAAGTTSVMCTATDLGTTDTPVGDLLSITTPGAAIQRGGVVQNLTNSLVLPVGQVELVTATGGDGVIQWVVTYVPIDDGASIVAA